MLFSKGYVQISLNSSNREGGRMSKDLDYEFNNFANLLHKDCMNLMECLKKQSEDNKPILYLGKHYEKVILPYEEYQKMCNRLEAIDNANPSEAMECLKRIDNHVDKDYDYCQRGDYNKDYNTLEATLLKSQKQEKELVKYKKFWEIVKEKPQAELSLIQLGKIKTYEEYLDYTDKWELDLYGDMVYTEEEFNLLKGILNDEQ